MKNKYNIHSYPYAGRSLLWGMSSRSPPLTFTLLCGIMTGIIRQDHGTGQKGGSWASHQRGPHNRRHKSAQYWPQEVQMTQRHVCGNDTKTWKENYLMQGHLEQLYTKYRFWDPFKKTSNCHQGASLKSKKSSTETFTLTFIHLAEALSDFKRLRL